MPTSVDSRVLKTLEGGAFTLEGKFVQGFNFTFLTKVKSVEGQAVQAVYKPQQGERPLWDFPDDTLAHRETAA